MSPPAPAAGHASRPHDEHVAQWYSACYFVGREWHRHLWWIPAAGGYFSLMFLCEYQEYVLAVFIFCFVVHVLMVLITLLVAAVRFHGNLRLALLPSPEMSLMSALAVATFVVVICAPEAYGCMNDYRYFSLAVVWTFYLIGAGFSHQVRGLFFPQNGGQGIITQLLEQQDKPPSIMIHGEAYHFESRTETYTTTDSQGRSTTATRQVTEKVVTHTASEAFVWQDYRCRGPTFNLAEFSKWKTPTFGSFRFYHETADDATDAALQSAITLMAERMRGLDVFGGASSSKGNDFLDICVFPGACADCGTDGARTAWRLFVGCSVASCTVVILLFVFSLFSQGTNFRFVKEVTVKSFDERAKRVVFVTVEKKSDGQTATSVSEVAVISASKHGDIGDGADATVLGMSLESGRVSTPGPVEGQRQGSVADSTLTCL